MEIESIECELFRVPATMEMCDSIQNITHWEWLVVTVRTHDGLVGTGFTYTLGAGGSAVSSLVRDQLAPRLIGQDAHFIGRLWIDMWRTTHANGSSGIASMAIAAIDVALHDLGARAQDLPLYRYLGPTRESVPVYASGIDLHLDTARLLTNVKSYVDDGYSTVKIKVGRPAEGEDLERVGAVRRLIGDSSTLLLDANQAWSAGAALTNASALEAFRPAWLEEPVLAEDLIGNARVRSHVRTPIALGETLYSKHDFARYIQAEAVDIVQADIARVGGLTEWRIIASLAAANNLVMAPHFIMELSVHALCSINNGLILENVMGASLADIGLAEPSVTIHNGIAYPSQSPGHGITLMPDAARYRVSV